MLTTFRFSFRVLLSAALFMAFAVIALGQSTATLQGTVTDQKGSGGAGSKDYGAQSSDRNRTHFTD